MRWPAKYFELPGLGTNWRTEILAGCTTFRTMAYIIFVNRSILVATGMPVAAVTAGTRLSAGFASIFIGAVAHDPLAIASGMGRNAYFSVSGRPSRPCEFFDFRLGQPLPPPSGRGQFRHFTHLSIVTERL